jgi:hypothetical protein
MSVATFLIGNRVKPAPGIPQFPTSLSSTFAPVLPAKLPGSESRSCWCSACRCSRDHHVPVPQESLAPVRVMLSRSIIAYYNSIRQSHGHAATSRPSRLYAAPSLCGSAEATPGTFPTFTAVLSKHAVDPTPVARFTLPLLSFSGSRLPRIISESSSTKPVAASYIRRGNPFSGLHRSLYAAACLFA